MKCPNCGSDQPDGVKTCGLCGFVMSEAASAKGGPALPVGGPVSPVGGPVLPAGGPMPPVGGPVPPAGGPVPPVGSPALAPGGQVPPPGAPGAAAPLIPVSAPAVPAGPGTPAGPGGPARQEVEIAIAPLEPPKKTNPLVLAGAGVACLAAAGFFIFIKPMLDKRALAPPPAPAAASAPAAPAPGSQPAGQEPQVKREEDPFVGLCRQSFKDLGETDADYIEGSCSGLPAAWEKVRLAAAARTEALNPMAPEDVTDLEVLPVRAGASTAGVIRCLVFVVFYNAAGKPGSSMGKMGVGADPPAIGEFAEKEVLAHHFRISQVPGQPGPLVNVMLAPLFFDPGVAAGREATVTVKFFGKPEAPLENKGRVRL